MEQYAADVYCLQEVGHTVIPIMPAEIHERVLRSMHGSRVVLGHDLTY